MFQIVADNEIIYDPRSNKRQITDVKIQYIINKAGTLTFTIPNDVNIVVNKLTTNIKMFENNKIVFEGVVFNTQKNIYNTESVTVLGVLDYFNHSIQEPFNNTFNNAKDFLKFIVDRHNKQVDGWKIFEVGKVDVPIKGEIINSKHEEYLTTWDLIQSNLLDSIGGYLSVRYENDMKYLDYTLESGKEPEQIIRFGSNILDLDQFFKAEELKTIIIPIGKKLEDGTYITIKSVNGGKGYLENAEAIKTYGRVVGVKTWEDVTEPINLLNKAKEYLKTCGNMITTIELNAVDLHDINVNIDRLEVGDYPLIISEPHNLATRLQLVAKTIDLENPDKNRITLGTIREGLISSKANDTKKIENSVKEANIKINKIHNEVNKDSDNMKLELNKQKVIINLGGFD